MPQQDIDYKKKTGKAIFKQNINIPTENHPAMGMLGAGSIGTGVTRAGSGLLKGILRKIIPSPKAIKTVTARPVPGSGLARIQRDFASLPSNRVTAPAYKITGMKVTKAAKDAAASDARSTVMRDRVKGLARQAELGAIRDKKAATDAGLGTDASTMRTRVMKLARQAELDKKAAMDKAKVKGSSSVGYRDAPLPGSAAAIPRGGDVPMIDKLPGRQLSTGSSVYKRRRK